MSCTDNRALYCSYVQFVLRRQNKEHARELLTSSSCPTIIEREVKHIKPKVRELLRAESEFEMPGFPRQGRPPVSDCCIDCFRAGRPRNECGPKQYNSYCAEHYYKRQKAS